MDPRVIYTYDNQGVASRTSIDYLDSTIDWQSTAFPIDSTDYARPEITYSGPHDAQFSSETTNSHLVQPYVDEHMVSNYNCLNTPLQVSEDYGVFSPSGSSEWTSSDCLEPWQAQPAYEPTTPLLSSGELIRCV
jgi:hypothetical protein